MGNQKETPENRALSGILVIDKPAGWTSMDVCAKLRGILHTRRIGHGGTLDPMATGVLPVFVGSAAKAVSFAENSRKEYVGVLRLGVTTDTQDITGAVVERRPANVTQAELRAAFARFTGESLQIPPMYSAIKIQGRKLYDLARAGKEIARPPRTVTIYELELLEQKNDTDYAFRCLCSKGTYVRTLCHDIGQFFGCGGTLCALRRTMAAGFREADAITLKDVQERGAAALRPLDSLFVQYPAFTVCTPGQERRIRSGQPIAAALPDSTESPESAKLPGGVYRVYGQDGDFLCLSEVKDGNLVSIKNFFGS